MYNDCNSVNEVAGIDMRCFPNAKSIIEEHDTSESILDISREFDLKDDSTKDMILLLAINVENVIERRYSIDIVLKKRYGVEIECNVEYDQQMLVNGRVVRIVAMQVLCKNSSEILRLLYALSPYSLLFYATGIKNSHFSENVAELFCRNIQKSTLPTSCCKYALENQISFIRVILGNDGFSINRIYT